ncbi:ABC transporter permease subunit [Salinibacterium sp. NSLL150]|uniref:ABC transporter permease subunit n=1 Tax=unclassified Salinibacterium TaxID=2632331 RepID=UPI0018CDA74D|nr:MULTISPECIES: ABC transporter permease subunit [unclassified Salinibacterium]MBH0097525.1 ABC transporter permease subunit [Salinibacterium sp. NSLL35]MBH0100280.1 ABC transporter permease subunit [Salinibacterium sp. NSLL150]MBH0103039.1 ABC transporter permease subunit [Salinibacterium sp. NSLL16]MBH0105800.1 ABC transporter permease subunit [Salinibacterium sp. NSLL17]MBH0110421.1 ABC transporter permease subunit [Salinibacterium sp. NG22]
MSTEAETTQISLTARPPSRRVRGLVSRWLLLTPIIAFYVIFFLWPILTVVLRSLSLDGKFDAAAPSFTLDNFAQLIGDDFLLLIEGRTLLLAINSTLITTALAFPTAYFISRLNRKTASVLLLLILIPFWVSIVVRLFAVTSILSPNGPVNQASLALGFGETSLLYTQAGTLVGTVMYLLPYMILVLYAGMVAVDSNLMLAARTMGASASYAFFRVYIPMIRSSLLSGALLIFILALSFFVVPAILGGPRDQTIAVYIQQQIDIFQWGTASAMGMVLLIATVICYVGVVRIAGTFQPGGVGSVQAKGVSAGQAFRWSPIMIMSAALSAITIAILVIPVLFVFPLSTGETGTVVFPPRGFTLEWFVQVFTTDTWLGPIMQSSIVGVGTAVLSVGIALALARVTSEMTSTTGKAIIGGLAFAPIIAPSILLAIGIFDVELQLKLTGTVIGLILAHTVIAAPLSYALIAASMAGADRGIEAAAWTLGASRIRTFWTVVVRGILPSALGAFAIAFVTSWDEVVLALFLQTGPTKTLPVTIYKYLESGIIPTVPAVASLLIALVVLIVVVRGVVGSISARRRAAQQEESR